MNWYYRRVPESAVRHAAFILTVSNASKTEIVRQLGLPEDAVVVTYEAAREEFHRYADSWRLEECRQRHELPPEFILGIGSSDPRKNMHTLIEAYAMLPQSLQQRFSLVILLNHQRFAKELRQVSGRMGLNDRALFRSVGTSAAEMAKVFNLASLFVFPSLSEGFGLPPLEAMACGTPVIAARNSSIPEVLGDAALLVDAHDADALAHTMNRLLFDEGLRAQLAERGLKRAARFSWQRCARQTLAVYEHAIGRSPIGQLTSFVSVH